MSRPHNLPAELTSFVGRRRELSEVKRLLTQTRLLTLTGSGGAGKTRLALRAAAEMARSFPDGVWLVSLASIDDPQLVVQAVISALGLQDTSGGWSLSRLNRYLADKHLLLVLDNCEHLLDSCALLAVTLLTSCPELRVLATSRQGLGTTGETRMRVPPLALPEQGASLGPEQIATYEAVALLSERAAAVVPSFKVDHANSAAVLRLCWRLDGMPLALELAAVQLEGLTVEQVVSGLENELPVLAKGSRGAEARQRTLEATLAWSYGLLEEPERLLWARLSVFAGGFDQEAAVEVCSDERLPADRIPPVLGALVEKSVLKRELGDGTRARYFLLETLRHYGRLRLRELGEESGTRKRHFDWIRKLAGLVGAWDSRQPEMLRRMHQERDNLWAALEYCLRQPSELAAGAELAQHLMVYWNCRGPHGDVRRVLTSLAELTPEDTLPRGRLLWMVATMAAAQNDYAACAALSQESLRVGTLLKDAEVMAWSSVWLSASRWSAGDPAEATQLVQSAISLADLRSVQQVKLAALTLLSHISFSTGELDRAIEVGERQIGMSRESGELWFRSYALNVVSQASWLRGERQQAEAEAQEAAVCKHALDDRQGLAILLETLAWMAAERGAHRRAATLLGLAHRVRESNVLTIQEHFRLQHERTAELAVQGLGRRAFDAVFEQGRAMTTDEGVAFAVEEKEPSRPTAALNVESSTALTRRELEIAHLIADGLTSQQIAGNLFISERTVTTHVTNMLNKLGLSSRIQLARWVAGASQQARARDS